VQRPAAAVVANVSAQPVLEPQQLRSGFVEQLVSPVRWHECVAHMAQAGVGLFVEVGPGNVLTNLGARSFRSAQFHSTSDVDGLEKTLAVVRGGQ
jgi:[acyl-carrier-protein] S-malonyltransferase